MKFKPFRKETSGKSRRRIVVGAILTAFVLAVALGTVGLSPKASKASPRKYKATKEIVRDTATGELRKPTAAETDAMVAQISQLTNRSTEGLTETPGANGGTAMVLEGRFQSVVLGRANPDGTTEVKCVFSIEEAADFLGLQEE